MARGGAPPHGCSPPPTPATKKKREKKKKPPPGAVGGTPPPQKAENPPYLDASPACWRRWAELMTGSGAGRLSTDAYAAQHPGVDGRRQRQSVAVHLIALCHELEHGLTDPFVTDLTRRALINRPDWPWLDPPDSYAVTARDLAVPVISAEIRRLAEAVWDAWASHHHRVRQWAADLLVQD